MLIELEELLNSDIDNKQKVLINTDYISMVTPNSEPIYFTKPEVWEVKGVPTTSIYLNALTRIVVLGSYDEISGNIMNSMKYRFKIGGENVVQIS